jgi:hypothetical protein
MASQFENENWSDKFKWKMDLVKSAVTYLIVTIGTIYVFRFGIDRTQHKWEIDYGTKLETMKDYKKASTLYMTMGYDAMRDKFILKKDRQLSKNIQDWEDVGYDNAKMAKESLKFWFDIDNPKDSCGCQDNSSKNTLSLLLDKLDASKYRLKYAIFDKIDGFRDSIILTLPPPKNTLDSTSLFNAWKIFYDSTLRKESLKYYIINDSILKECNELLKED